MNWKQADRVYGALLLWTNTPYAELAKKMLNLIDHLRQEPDLIGITGMMTLILGVANKRGSIYIDWDFNTHLYYLSINLHESAPPSADTHVNEVDESDLLDTVREYIDMLRKTDDISNT